MTEKFIITQLFTIPLLACSLQLILSKQPKASQIFQITASALFLIISLYCFFFIDQTIIINIANWLGPFSILLVLDNLAKLALVLFSIVILCINIYSSQDKTLANSQIPFYIGSWTLVLAISGALLTYDIFNLYVWSEVMLVSSFMVLMAYHKKRLNSLYHYAVINIIGTLLMLIAVAFLYGITGSLNYFVIAKSLQSPDNFLAQPAVILLILGLCVKGAIFPFYFWLPKAYPNSSATTTMFLASTTTKVILLVILRLVWLWAPLQTAFTDSIFITLACCTMFFGVMGAAINFRVRSILSFHVVSQIGYILLTIFIPTVNAAIAALYFLIHNVFVKTSLIMTSGLIESRYHTDQLKKLGTVLKDNRILGIAFLIPALSLAGFPPLSGFWGKFFIFKAALNHGNTIALTIAILVSLFTLYSMIKIWRYVFCETAEKQILKKPSHQLSKIELIALCPLVIMPILMGIFPDFLVNKLNTVATELNHIEHIGVIYELTY